MMTQDRVNVTMNATYTPFYVACEKGHTEVVKSLMAYPRISVNKTLLFTGFEEPFFVACEKGHSEIVQMIINDPRIDVNSKSNTGKTPFFIACENNHLEVVKHLLENERIDPNKPDDYKTSPIFLSLLKWKSGTCQGHDE